MNKITSANEYFEKHKQWQTILGTLRRILQATELQETIKWGTPVYTISGKNVVGIGAFKSYAGLWFFNGALLSDKQGKLINAQEGKTKAMRQWRFADSNEIDPKLVEAYVIEAIELQKAGKVVAKKKPAAKFELPVELRSALEKDKLLSTQFKSMTLYKQKEFAEHIGSAKREETRENRLAKSIGLILEGVGLNDKYRNC